jgi:hypothetical protein
MGDLNMKYAIINNGLVENLVVADYPLSDNWVEASDEAQIGGIYDGEFHPAPPASIVAPSSITPRQARLALLAADLLDAVESAFAKLPAQQRKAAQIEWQYASAIKRNSPLVSQFGPLLGLTEVQIDELFVSGSQL